MEKRPNPKGKQTVTTRKSKTIRRAYDPNYNGSKGEVNSLPSRTQPDMSLTIPELMRNHTRQLSSDIHINEGEFFDEEIPRFDDITEKIAYKDQLKADLKETEAKAKSENATNRKKRLSDEKLKKEQDLANAKKLLENQPKTPTEGE